MPSAAPESFPCALKIRTPFPTTHLAKTALTALSVDAELSPLVRRSFHLDTASPVFPEQNVSSKTGGALIDNALVPQQTVLVTEYRATTNRMLRVATNGFFESLGVVLGVMRELDVDVVEEQWRGDGDELNNEKREELRELKRVQGLTETGRLDAGVRGEKS